MIVPLRTQSTRSESASGDAIVRADGLHKHFGDVQAVVDVSFGVAPGSILGIIGPSGGGKTTLLRLLCGLETPTSGRAECFGVAASRLRGPQRADVSLLAQDPAVMDEFTIREQLLFQARLRSVPADQIDSCLDRVGLGEAASTRLADASGGMRRRCGLASALIGDPTLFFSDEPTAGLDPIVRDQIWAWFRRRRKDGRTMVVTTQHIDEAARCDRVIVLQGGSVVADTEPHELAAASGLNEELVIVVAADDQRRAVDLIEPLGRPDVHGEEIVLITDNASQAAGDVASMLHGGGIDVVELDTRVPGLDEVFRSIVEQHR